MPWLEHSWVLKNLQQRAPTLAPRKALFNPMVKSGAKECFVCPEIFGGACQSLAHSTGPLSHAEALRPQTGSKLERKALLGGLVWSKTQQWPQDWKRSVFIPIPKKGNAKECSNYRTFVLISRASKVMLKILQARLQQYVNHELPDIQARFRKGRGTRDQIANIRWIMEKAREFQVKHLFLLY